MKKKKVVVFVGMFVLLLLGCGNTETETIEDFVLNEEASESEQSETKGKEIDVPVTEEGSAEETTSLEHIDIKDTLSFADFKNLEFLFCSGAGGWGTTMTIKEDGSFVGKYSDSEMGSRSDSYPNGTIYQCVFSGQLVEPKKINEYTYSMSIQEISYEQEAGTREIKDGILYIYDMPYGLENTDELLVYMPGAPLAELPDEFRSWVGYYDLSYQEETQLPFYALYNETEQYGFSSYDPAGYEYEVSQFDRKQGL